MQIYRCNISKYQASNYAEQEKQRLEKLGLHYQTPEIGPTSHPDIVITNSNTDLKRQNIDWSQVKLLLHPNSGYDNIHPKVIEQMNAPIVLGNPIRANAVTTYTLACLFQAFTPLPETARWDNQRQWNRKNIDQLQVLLVGYGHIGQLLYQSLNALTPFLKVYDPYTTAPQSIDSFEQLEQFDAILLAPSLTSSSYHMIDHQFLKKVKRDVVIINGARGKLIEQDSILKFLKSNPEAKAYIDVFENEPADFTLWENFIQRGQVHLTSHIAGVYQDLDSSILNYLEQVIQDFLHQSKDHFYKQYGDLILQEKLKRVPHYDP